MNQGPSSIGTLLWVGPASSLVSRQLAIAAPSAGIQFDIQPDPYSALAAIGLLHSQRATQSLPVVVAMEMDAWETRDFEFIQLLHKYFPRVALWVATENGLDCKVELAAKLGADQRLTSSNAASLLAAFCAKRELSNPMATFRKSPVHPLITEPQMGRGHENPPEATAVEPLDSVQPDDRPAENPAGGLEKNLGESKPVPVPWSRNIDAPERTPPQRPMRRSIEENFEENEAESPLLTDEEMEALIGREAGRREVRP